MASKVETILVKAKALIERRGWAQGAMGISQFGKERCYMSPLSDKFSAYGAIYRTATIMNGYVETGPTNFAPHALDALAVAAGLNTPSEFRLWHNLKRRTKEEVLEVFDKAIARLRFAHCGPVIGYGAYQLSQEKEAV